MVEAQRGTFFHLFQTQNKSKSKLQTIICAKCGADMEITKDAVVIHISKSIK
jgi:hypothetical protein